MTSPIRIHPLKKKVFEYKRKPVLLLCATEHYGSIMNRPFDFKKYLEYCKKTGQNYTRLFLLFRELQTPVNPYSTCKPESPDYISPYVRSGPGTSADGLLKYDLDSWNEEFFERLHNFMKIASGCDVIVEVTLFSNNYSNELLSLIPFGIDSNINGVGDEKFEIFMTMKNAGVFDYQIKFVQKIVTELNCYDNFFFEICNEQVSFTPEIASVDEINNWQQHLIDYVRNLESELPKKHLIAVTECWKFHNRQTLVADSDASFNHLTADIVNIHPLENIVYKSKSYNMGLFMSKQLCLKELRDYCLDTWNESKPLNIDEDNVASRFKDYEGWTIHRKRAWTVLFSGAHYDYIDFSIVNYCPTGTPDSQEHLHKWFKNIREFISSVDIISGSPLTGVALNFPGEVLESVFGTPGKQYNIYIADKRELEEYGQGEIISGEIELEIKQGKYIVLYYSPEHGTAVSGNTTDGGRIKLNLPDFRHDLVIQLKNL